MRMKPLGARARLGMSGSLLLLATVVTGCTSNSTGTFLPQVTNGPVTPTSVHVGSLTVRNLLIEEPHGGQSYEKGADARMGLEVVNEGQTGDTLLSVDT